MRFRPCIDLHDGAVKQIVGGTLTDSSGKAVENFVSTKSAGYYAALYRDSKLTGGHVIKLGPGNDAAAKEALAAWPGGLQVGGGVNASNAKEWIDAGASHVIVTSAVFSKGVIDWEALRALVDAVGREHLVLDLSCKKRPLADRQKDGDERYYVVTDRWQKYTDYAVTEASLRELGAHCSEFLVHAVDVEGLRGGVQEDLVEMLGAWAHLPVTYAGGARNLDDLELVRRLGRGRVDLTIGSALDIFGGDLSFTDVVAWQRQQESVADSSGRDPRTGDGL